MTDRSSFPDRDLLGQRLAPGDRVVFDVLGRPIKVHPSRICRTCGELRDSAPVCPCCGTVAWRGPISISLTSALLLVGAFAARDDLAAPWGAVVFWVCLVLGGCYALGALTLWYQALKGVGIELNRLVGGALLFGGLGWLVDWWTVGGLNTWAIVGAVGGASLELIAEQIYFRNDPRR